MKLIDGIYDTDPVPEDSTVEQVFAIYQNRLKPNRDMLNELLRKRPSFVNLTTDEAILAYVENLESDAGKVPGLTGRVSQLENELDAFRQKEAAAHAAEIKGIVDGAVADGRIKEPQRSVYANLLEKDFANGKAAIEGLQPAKRAVNSIAASQGTDEVSPWDKRMQEIENKLKK